MYPDRLPEEIARRLRQHPLPGPRAQRRMAPQLTYGRHRGPSLPTARPAAVAVLLYRRDQWMLPLTLRPAHLRHHPGQICLPGGRARPGESAEAAALRELHEELGVSGAAVHLCGRLTPLYVYASNHSVVPVVVWTETPPEFVPDGQEVAGVLEFPLADLARHDTRTHLFLQRRIGPQRRQAFHVRVPCWQLMGHAIWGATAMIMAELAAVLEDLPA